MLCRITLPDGRKVDPRVLRETDEIGHGAYGRVVRVVYDEQILAVKYVRLSINSPADDSSTVRLSEHPVPAVGMLIAQCVVVVV